MDTLQNTLNNANAEHPILIGDILTDAYAEIESFAQSRGTVSGLLTGFTDLDNILHGLDGGELIVVGARPAMGKTSFALNVVSHTAIQSGKSVALFCLECSRRETALRILCSVAGVSLQMVRNENLTNELRVALEDSLPAVSSAPIYIDDTPCPTPGMISDICRELKSENKLDLVVIDYLGLMQADEESGNRNREISAICRALKTIARELDVPIILCTQLARPGKGRTDRYPNLNDLRDSGSLEREADVILLLHREDYFDAIPKLHETCDVIIAKHRDGPLGTVRLAWLQECSSFANLSGEWLGQ